MSLPPILFVPGAFTGGWIWEAQFMPYFREAGYAVQAVTFPSHQAPALRRQRLGLASALAHLTQCIEALPQPPILIAHSLGGLIAQQVMQHTPLAAVALLSPVPPDGLLRSAASLVRRSPVSLAKLLAVAIDARVTRYGTPPVGIYSDSCEPQVADAITRQLRGESLLALGQALWRRTSATASAVPLHFWGAEGDYIIPASEVRRTAQRYGAPVTIYPGMSHTFQAETEWQRVAGDIEHWLRRVTA